MTDNSSINKRAARALAIVGSSKVIEKLLSFATTLVLARLLTPSDYGVMALAMVFIGFIAFFNEIGLGAAIVQQKEISDEALDGSFFTSILFSTSLFIVAATTAPFAAHFLGNSQLTTIIPVLAFGFVLGGAASVSTSLLRKEMRYKPLAIVSIVAVAIQSAVSIALAAFELGVWALIAGFIASQVVRTIGALVSAKWLPKKIQGFRAAYTLIRYGLQVTYSRLLFFLSENLDNIIIGRLNGERVLGLYSMGVGLATIATSHITSVVVDVASPLFAKLQGDPERLSQSACQITRGLAFLVFPILLGSAAVADDLVPVALGSQWTELIPSFRILCFAVIIRSIAPVLSQLLISTGHARTVTRNMAWNVAVLAISISVGAHYFGLSGAAMAWLLAYPTTFALQLYCAITQVGLSLRNYTRAITPALTASILMFFSVMLIAQITHYQGLPHASALAIEVVVGAATYSVWLIYFSGGALRDLRDALVQMGVAQDKLTFWPFSKLAPGTP